jgi:hypothetical protein
MAARDNGTRELYTWTGKKFEFCMDKKSSVFNKKNITSLKRASRLDASGGENDNFAPIQTTNPRIRKKFDLIFRVGDNSMPDYVKDALKRGTKTGAGADRRLVVWAENWNESADSVVKPMFCICSCLEVREYERDDIGRLVSLHCKMLTHSGSNWQLKRPEIYHDGVPKENSRVIEGVDKKTECWVLPPLFVHAKMNIFSIDSVDTVHQTCSADFFFEFRLRGISEVCVDACINVYMHVGNTRL